MSVSSPNVKFDNLIELFHQDDSNEQSNIGFDEEITQAVLIEVNFMHSIWSSTYGQTKCHTVCRAPDKMHKKTSNQHFLCYCFTKFYVDHLLNSSWWDHIIKWSNIGFGEEKGILCIRNKYTLCLQSWACRVSYQMNLNCFKLISQLGSIATALVQVYRSTVLYPVTGV